MNREMVKNHIEATQKHVRLLDQILGNLRYKVSKYDNLDKSALEETWDRLGDVQGMVQWLENHFEQEG